jgi:hypothetical protein
MGNAEFNTRNYLTMKKQPDLVDSRRTAPGKWTLFIFALVIISMALALLFHNLGVPFFRQVSAAPGTAGAGDLSVVGQPSLPAATVDAIFRRLGSPMVGTGRVVEQVSRQANIDDAFALAVWWTETNDGAAGVGLADRNPGSVRGSVGYPSAFDGYTIYPSYSAAITYWFPMLRNRYVNQGLSTVYAISHPYVGTSSSPLWAGKVVALMLRYRGEAPPPAPMVAPSPTIPAYMYPHHKKIIDPGVYSTATVPFPYQNQAQTGKTDITEQPKTRPALPLAVEYIIVFLALLLALAIVVWSFRLDGGSMRIMGIGREMRANANSRVAQNEAYMAAGLAPLVSPDLHTSALRPITLRSITRGMSDPDTNALPTPAYYTSAPNTDALGLAIQHTGIPGASTLPQIPAISVSQGISNVHFDGPLHTETHTEANFRVRRTIFLPSVPIREAPGPGELAAPGSKGTRSTGLLSRYGETNQA